MSELPFPPVSEEVIAGRYELLELVGRGGMSTVWKAQDRLLDRTVAIKVLHEQFTQDEEYVERFRREARSVAQLRHPNIVPVLDRGEDGGRRGRSRSSAIPTSSRSSIAVRTADGSTSSSSTSPGGTSSK